jgi:subtilisin-like proprotein convertase family protein
MVGVTNGKLHWYEDGDGATSDLTNAFLTASTDNLPWQGGGQTTNLFGGFNLFGMAGPIAHEASSAPADHAASSVDAGGDGSLGAEAARKPTGSGSTSGTGTSTSGTGTSGTGTSGTGTSGTGSSGTSIVAVTMMSPTLGNLPVGLTTNPTDSYFAQEWNLTSATGGVDVVGAWKNYTGAGIKLGIVDNGVDNTVTDLSPHFLSSLSYNAVSPGSSTYATANHGTWVAGVAAAAANGSGVVGVAPGVGFAAFEIGYGSAGNTTQYADALNHLLTSGMDVANASWGYSTPFQDNFASYWSGSASAILNDVQHGRGGLGMDIVFAAMNNRTAGDNVNYHNYQNDPYVITVGATDANGKVASFSNPGAALLVSAPGTYDITDNSPGSYQAVEGTSFAAPTVSGIIAEMLQANPNLGFRDVQEILAYSAKQTDPTNAGWEINGAHDWNGGGLHFSQDYGFGLVDATAAVRLAESWDKQSTYADMSTETVAHTDNLAYSGGSTIHSQINFTTALDLDKVVLDLNITDANVSGLTVTLTSASGTVATLVSHPSSGTGGGINFEMSANNFMGENALGNWTLTVSDSVAGDTGTLNGWTLKGLGDAASTPEDYIYTNEFGTEAGASRAVLHDTSGTAMINTAAVSSACSIDLHAGATCTIAGRALQIGTDTTIKSFWAGDGNDTITANDAGDIIQGGRGNDTIVAGHGADVLSGGPGNDVFVFNFANKSADEIKDFSVGNDVLDMRQLFQSIGYAGVDPVVDHWLTLSQNANGGTDFVIDPHNGTAAHTVVTLDHVAPGMLHQGTDYLTHAIV